MKINLRLIKKVLEEQRNRDKREKGAQPEMILGCFNVLHEGDNEVCYDNSCHGCHFYDWKCRIMLEAYKIDENPLRK